ncbi:MAG: uroporphyrinogen-III C-methyltransferase [Ruminococcus sp.]|nr:uroporphyrinogen-III C-methyltransferase [Ruminococcus sp.]
MSTLGKVYLVGAGCGSYDLITLRGKSLIEQCDVVIYDSLIDSSLLDFAPDNAEKICVGKRAGCHSETQENINTLLVEKAKEGKIVVRLKGGDPFVFGRGGEEILSLQENNIEYAVVPGISSAIAVPELAGIPVTHRKLSRSFHIITGHTADDLLPENMSAYARLDGTLVFLMGLKNLKQITDSLIKNGKAENTPAAVISNGASTNQQVVRSTLKNIAEDTEKQNLKAPAIIVVGDVANFDFSQTLSLPLQNISVTVTGTKRFTSKMSSQLIKLGASIKKLDYLNVIEYRDNSQLDNALMSITDYSWIVLTSINGAEIFLNRLNKLKIDIRKLAKIKIAVIGSGTASVLEKYGIFADLIPESYTSKALGNQLAERVLQNEKVLILRAEQGSAELSEILTDNNINYDDIKTYDVLSNTEITDNTQINTDFITFASSSGVNAFFENGYKISPKTKIICIGEITANVLRKHNINDFQISKTSNVDGITDTILREV